jgi:hypothetical protein
MNGRELGIALGAERRGRGQAGRDEITGQRRSGATKFPRVGSIIAIL